MLNFDAAFQSQVVVAVLDDFTPNAVLPNLHGGQYGDSPGAWREAVIEFIRSMLSAGLIAPFPGREGYDSKNTQEICEILLFGDADNELDASLVWGVIHFCETNKLVVLLRELGLDSW